MRTFLRALRRLVRGTSALGPAGGRQEIDHSAVAVTEYWTRHNVTSHKAFANETESLAYLRWRNDQYFGYAERMPVLGQDGKVVLDFGCGPGHDLVGFGVQSRPARLIGCDVSPSSLEEARKRLALHSISAELIQLEPDALCLPQDDASVDHIHSSGVIHHTVDPVAILREFRRSLRSGGTARIMVYNYESLWLHLYVAYQKLLAEGRYAELDIREAFSRTTDGEDCPIASVYRPVEFIALAQSTGFSCEYVGAAISAFEASLFPMRFKAIMDLRLREESRRFLAGLRVDDKGLPTHEGHYAGVDACFLLRKE